MEIGGDHLQLFTFDEYLEIEHPWYEPDWNILEQNMANYIDYLKTTRRQIIVRPLKTDPKSQLDPTRIYWPYLAGYPPMLHYIKQSVLQMQTNDIEQQSSWKTKLRQITDERPQMLPKPAKGHVSLIRRNCSIPVDQPQPPAGILPAVRLPFRILPDDAKYREDFQKDLEKMEQLLRNQPNALK